MSQSAQQHPRRAALRRVLSALAVMAVLAAALGICDAGYGAPLPPAQRFTAAQSAVDALRADPKRAAYRAPWLELADEFYAIYTQAPRRADAPAALYASARTLEELARRSWAKGDFRQAAERYEQLAQRHAASSLAAMSLYGAARIRARYLDDRAGALQRIARLRARYPKAKSAADAAALERKLRSDAPTASPAATTAGRPPAEKARRGGAARASKSPGKAPAVRAVSARDSLDLADQLGLTVQTVFIDAGHGGRDPGTVHNKVVERDLALDIARRTGRLLEANGLEVLYSRETSVTIPLSSRPRMANKKRADLFVSIHINAHTNADASGFETYYLDLARTAQAARVATLENAPSDRKLGDMQKILADIMLNARARESGRLAADIQRLAVSRIGRRGFTVRNGGTKSAPFHVLIGAGMPAVLVEVGYCTNVREAGNLRNPSYRHAVAEGLAEGIMAYRNRLQRRNSAEIVLTPRS